MIDLLQVLQAVGLTGTLMFGGVALLLTLARAYSKSSDSQNQQQTIVTQMALKAQERAERLEEARYTALIKQNELTMRVNRLETELQRLPVVEAQIQHVQNELAEVKRERDAALLMLQDERVKNSELLGRIKQLEEQIDKLEQKIARLENERDQIIHIRDIPIPSDGGVAGAGTDGTDQRDERDDCDDDCA